MCILQKRGNEGFDMDVDEESTMLEDSVTPSKLVYFRRPGNENLTMCERNLHCGIFL
jgi:hypothetical protein